MKRSTPFKKNTLVRLKEVNPYGLATCFRFGVVVKAGHVFSRVYMPVSQKNAKKHGCLRRVTILMQNQYLEKVQ